MENNSEQFCSWNSDYDIMVSVQFKQSGVPPEICLTNNLINNNSIYALVETNQGITVLYYK